MDCILCDKKINSLHNYGDDKKPLCYDCSKKLEKSQNSVPADTNSVDFFLSKLLDNNNSKEIKTSQLNIPYLVVGIIGLLITFFLVFDLLINEFEIINIIPASIFIIFFFPFGVVLILLGLYHIRSSINLETRLVTITRRNWAFYKKKVTETFPLESLEINAICFTDVPTTWMVRIGCGDYAILSKEFYSVRERNAAMLGLMKKIFPERLDINESSIIEDGNQAFFKHYEKETT